MPYSNKIALILGPILILLMFAPDACALTQIRDGNELEITGLIVDRTITKGGHDFHDALIGYLGPDYQSPYTLTITEAAGMGRSTFVSIFLEDTLIFRSRLNPLPEQIDEMALTVANTIIETLTRHRYLLDELEYY